MTNLLPIRPTKREHIYDILDGERDYQDRTHPESPVPMLADFANLLIEYTDKLAVDVTVDGPSPASGHGPYKRLREIAAIAVRAMEVYGATPRENHVPASAGITGVMKIVAKADSTAPKPKPTVIVQPPRPSAPVAEVHAPHSATADHSLAAADHSLAAPAHIHPASTTAPAVAHHTSEPVATPTTQHGEAKK